MAKVDGGAPLAEAISKKKNAPASGLWKPTKLTMVVSIRTPDRLSTSTNSIAFLGHTFCCANTRATGSRGAGVARFCGMQAAPARTANVNTLNNPILIMMKCLWLYISRPLDQTPERAGREISGESRQSV